MVPSAQVTVLMSSTFLAVVLEQTQETEETERQRGPPGAAFGHFEVARRVPRRRLRPQTEARRRQRSEAVDTAELWDGASQPGCGTSQRLVGWLSTVGPTGPELSWSGL